MVRRSDGVTPATFDIRRIGETRLCGPQGSASLRAECSGCLFQHTLKLMGNITRAVGNDRLGCAERLLEFVFLAGYDVKNGDF